MVLCFFVSCPLYAIDFRVSKKAYNLLIVAGEASGDAHGAALVKALQATGGEASFTFFGSCGLQMRAVGIETIVDADTLTISGLPEVTKALPVFWRAFQKLKKTALGRKPDAAILLDFPDFNLRMAKALRKRGIPVIYYISPQVWAWRGYRVGAIKKYVDLLLTILPFEKKWYSSKGFERVEYVGHPLAGEVKATRSRAEFRQKYNLADNRLLVALLPGSRRKELGYILPEMLKAVALAAKQRPELQFAIALAPVRKREEVEAIASKLKSEGMAVPDYTIVEDDTWNVVGAADAAIVASGTAALETAILGTPMLVVYKVSAFNYHTHKPLISVPFYSLPNLIAQKPLVKELIQHDLTPEKISAEILRLLEPDINRRMRRELGEMTEKLGVGGASQRAAQAVSEFLAK
jgi:lipid-A-disaccharide synthase